MKILSKPSAQVKEALYIAVFPVIMFAWAVISYL